MKRTPASQVECTNGDIHLILNDSEIYMVATHGKNLETAAIKKLMKEEALRPLFLMRE